MKFELAYPCKPYVVNQKFGENGAYYQSHGINIVGHNGIDLRAKHGQPIYAAHDGIAYFETDNSGGEGVILITNESFDYKGGQAWFKTIYWHLCDYAKEPKYKSPVLDYQQKHSKQPMPIKRGDLLGYADSTGLSTGDHLHFGLKAIKPGTNNSNGEDAADVGIGNWITLDTGNGFLGAINPTSYFNGKYAQDPQLVVIPIIQEADTIVKAIEDLKKAETPQSKSVIESIIANLWASFLSLFTPKK